MSFTFIICDEIDGRLIRPLNEKTNKPYLGESYDAQSFISQFKEEIVIEISEPGHILKNDLTEAKRLLELAKRKLRSPGRYEMLADEIERFLDEYF